MFDNIFHSKSIERIRQMLASIRTRDFTLQYSLENLRGKEKELAQEINAVISEFRDMTHLQESQYQYFNTMLNTVNTCLIVTDDNYKVRWMNHAAINGLCGFKIDTIDNLASLSPTLPSKLKELRPKVQQLISYTTQDGQKRELASSVVHFFDKGFSYKLYSLENVENVVRQSETKAQQQLVSVLTHEMMNSLTPIISLSDTLCEGMQDGTVAPDEALMAIRAINRRSSGLLQFIENYRQLSKISAPQYCDIEVGILIADIQALYNKPHLHYNVENPKLKLHIDRTQMEQVLINLLKNADEACGDKKDACVMLSVNTMPGSQKVCIKITDNGCGILPDVLERIFVPFFTTKQKGSGIGLSICKQIINLHNGSITATSKTGTGTTFTILLPL